MNQMQGFCWPLSAPPGGAIDFRTSTAAWMFDLTIVSFANKPRDVVTPAMINASTEMFEIPRTGTTGIPGSLAAWLPPPPDVGCLGSWPVSYRFEIPLDWSSGIYAAKCVDAAGSLFYIPFVVTPHPERRKRIAVFANVNTWNAYNYWGGYSRYEPPAGQPAVTVSYARPNPLATPVEIDEAPFRADLNLLAPVYNAPPRPESYGIAFQCRTSVRAELWVLNWLRDAGYDVDVWPDIDYHAGIPDFDQQYHALILSTHPEYWSMPMLDHLQGYLDAGGSVLYLGGNGIYDCVEISADGNAMTAYGTQAYRPHSFASLGRDPAATLGVSYREYDSFNLERAFYRVHQHHLEVFAHTGLDLFYPFGVRGWNIPVGKTALTDGAASGWEIDRKRDVSPPRTQVLASRASTDGGSDMTLIDRRAHGKGFVFSVGSITFGGSLVVEPVVQLIVRNVLDMAVRVHDPTSLDLNESIPALVRQ